MNNLDILKKQNRSKQIAYWNMFALGNLNSLTEYIQHHKFPTLYTQCDRDWKDLYFTNTYHIQGKPMKETFISRSFEYIQYNIYSTLDRVALLKTQQFNLTMIKNQFWNRVANLKPTSKENYESRSIVRNILWKERLGPYLMVVAVSLAINSLSGIAQLKVNQRLVTFAALFVMAEVLVRVKKSDKIFYSIPVLPNEELEEERKKIIQQCLVFDGKINTYGLPNPIDQSLLHVAEQEEKQLLKKDEDPNKNREEIVKEKERKLAEHIQLLEAIGFNVISE